MSLNTELAKTQAIRRVERREAQRKRDETAQRTMAALERIAAALEWHNIGSMGTVTNRTHQICGNCGQSFPIGSIHICNAVRPTTAGNTYQP
jgi:hypothetical protein